MRKILIACLLLAPIAGCAQSEEIDAGEYVDGERKFTRHHAFTVELYNEDGAPTVGENTFFVRVAFPDPHDPEAEGKGIPNANITLDAHMPNEDVSMRTAPEVTYLGAGEYMIEGVRLERAGTWQFDFGINVGETVRESVSFAFELR